VLEAYLPALDTTPPKLTVRLGGDGVYARTPSGLVVVVHTARPPPHLIAAISALERLARPSKPSSGAGVGTHLSAVSEIVTARFVPRFVEPC
jgi:hypothetical protein